MQVNRPNTTGPAYDNKQGNSPAASPAKPQPKIYTPVPPPPPPPPPPVAKTPAPPQPSAEGTKDEVTIDPKTGTVIEQKPGTTTESKAGSTKDPKAGAATESKPEVTTDPKTGAATEHKPGTTTEPQAGSTKDPKAGAATESKPEVTTDPKTGAATEHKPGTTTEPQAGSTKDPRAGAATESKPEVTTDPKAGAATEHKPGTTAESKDGSTKDPKAGAATESKPGVTNEPNADTTTEPKAGTTTQPQPGATNEPKAGTATEPESTPTNDPKPGATTDPKAGTTTASTPGVTDEPTVGTMSAQDHAQTEHTRHTRAIRDPQAGNTIEGSTDDTKNEGLKDVRPDLVNPALDSFAQQHRTQIVTPHNVASDALKTWGKSHGLKDFDPDTSEVVTLDYQPEKVGSSTIVGKPTSRQSLTHAVLSNWRDPNEQLAQTIFGGLPFEKSPDFKPVDKLEDRSHFGWNSDGIQHFTGIYQPGGVYNANTQVPMKPSDLEHVASNTSGTVKDQLKDYWSTHEKDYRNLSKMSALKASEMQQREGSLSEAGRELVYRGSGLDPKRHWSDLTPQDIQEQKGPAAGVEVSPLSIYGYRSPSARVFHDVGDKETQKRLLYVPGNSSPWHEFDNDDKGTSEDKLRDWVVQQAKNPQTREALASQFSQADRPSGNFFAGVDSALSGIAAYPGTYKAPEQGFTGGSPELWKPHDIVSSGASDSGEKPIPGDVYDDLAGRQRLRGTQEAALTPSNTSVGWKKGLDLASQALNYVAPLALAFPELEIPMVLDGLAEIGTGISDVANGTGAQQSEGLGRIGFGLLNVVPIVDGKLGGALGKESKLPEIPSGEAESGAPFSSSVVETPPRDKPVDHFLQDGIDANASLDGIKPNERGVYNANGQAYVQVDGHPMRIQGVSTTDGMSTATVVDAKGNPVTGGTLVRTADGKWERAGTTKGGGGGTQGGGGEDGTGGSSGSGGKRPAGSQPAGPSAKTSKPGDPSQTVDADLQYGSSNIAHKGSLPTRISIGEPGKYDVHFSKEVLESGLLGDLQKFGTLPLEQRRRIANEYAQTLRDAQPKRDQLIKDSDAALNGFEFPTPEQRPWASLPEDATDLSGFTANIQKVSNGIVYGENHNQWVQRQHLIEQMKAGTYTKNNTSTLYMEHFSREVDGPDLDDFNRTGKMNPLFAGRMRKWDEHYAPNAPAAYTTPKLLEAAHDAGINIHPLENRTSQGIAADLLKKARGPHKTPEAKASAMKNFQRGRERTSNYAWTQEIEQHQSTNGNKPWIALMGAGHLNGEPGLPGLAVLTDATSVRIIPGAETGVANVSRSIPVGTDVEADFTIRMP